MRPLYFLANVSIAAILTACTQAPVEVVYKGSQNFSRNTSFYDSYSSPAAASPYSSAQNAINSPLSPAYSDATITSANTGNVSVNDLPPPSPAAKTPPAKPTGWQSSFGTEPAKSKEKTAFINPVEGRIITRFGAKGKGISHDGLTYAVYEGEPVYAAADGEVAYTGDKLGGYGNMVILKHESNRSTTYAHLSRISAERHTRMKQGDIIGYAGATGDVREPQLYFALSEGTKPVNPEPLLPSQFAALE